MEEKPTLVKFQFAEETRDSKYVDGVWGGPTPRGLINANFFLDTPVLPRSVVMDVSGSSWTQVDIETEQGPDGAPLIRRDVVASLLISANDAISIGQWLINTGQLILEAQAQSQFDDQASSGGSTS